MKIISSNKGLRVHFYCLILASLFVSALARAHASPAFDVLFQQTSINGVVSDALGPLPGVAVQVKGNSVVVVTNEQGKYSVQAGAADILVFSFVGFKPVEVTVSGRSLINVVLAEDATQLQELEINAGYYTVKDKERTGSIARITSKDIETQPVTNVLATMQGRMAGVDITQDGGNPMSGFRIRIRGQNSLRPDGNDPLYIIDGVPYSSETIGSGNTSTALAAPTSPITNINPADIASIEVLKDADATAIYGSRGANGVVLITTKKGRSGKTVIDLSASTSFGKVTRLVDLMNTSQYLEMRREAYANDGITPYPDFAYDINGTWDQNRYTDWQKEFLGGTAEIRNYTGSVTGGSDQTKYLLSASLHNETTVMPGDFDYSKLGVHFNMDHKSADNRFGIMFSGNYTYQKNNQAAFDLTRASRTLAPNAPQLYDDSGMLNWDTFANPLAQLAAKNEALANDLVANALLSYLILPELEFKTSLGFTSLENYELRTMPSTVYNPSFGLGSDISNLSTSNVNRKAWIVEPQLRWSKSFGKLSLDVLLGGTAQNVVNRRLQLSGYGFSSNSLIYDMASAASKNVTLSDEVLYRYQAFFSRLNFNWEGKYLLNITGRRDGSSRFGPGNRFAWFGAVGGAWLFSQEKFMAEDAIISFGKLRASYGTSGNDQIGDYQYLNTYASSGMNYGPYTGLNPLRLYNPDFGWEKNTKFEVALEAGLLKDRIFITTAHYQNRSSNQLIGIQLPATTGFTSMNGNLDATVRNSGWEFTLRSDNVDGKDFSWSTNFNIAVAKNKLLSFPGLEGSTYANTYVLGESVNIRKLYTSNGVDPQTGLYTFKDYNSDGIISDPDRQFIADLNPKFFGGLQNQFRYKQLSLDFLFQFVKQENTGYSTGATPGTMTNQSTTLLDRWQKPGDSSGTQRFTSGADSDAVQAYNTFLMSNASIVDASFIRLKNIQLSYELPLKDDKLKCRLFMQGQNLLTITSFDGDPEFRFSGYLPPLKLYTIGFQLTF